MIHRRLMLLVLLGTITGSLASLHARRAQGQDQSSQSHLTWVADALIRMHTIKPGMTRSDLLKVFTTEGGLSTRTHRTYVLKQCPTIKVDVEFSISGNEA